MHVNKFLKIIFKNNQVLKIQLYDNPLSNYLYSAVKHLQHVPLNFFDDDIFFNDEVLDLALAKKKLQKYASYLDIEVDLNKVSDQYYLNSLHEIYEKNFNGSALWLKFHEHIHIVEKINYNLVAEPIISINYRTLAGKLEKPFLREYYIHAVSKIKKNQCFMRWQELAKSPYSYYLNKEPNNINRLCELSKPWITLRPSFHIACDDLNLLKGVNIESFDNWFAYFKDEWCKHWDILDWNSLEMFKVIPIGEFEDTDILVNNIKNNNFPIKITP